MRHRIALTVLTVAALGLSIVPAGCYNRNAPQPQAINPRSISPQEELRMKHTLLNQDVSKTDLLCRTQCKLDLQTALQKLQHTDNSRIQAELKRLTEEHPHMDQLVWTSMDQPHNDGVKAGQLKPELLQTVRPLMDHAKKQVKKGQAYQSTRIAHGGTSYFVLGVPSTDGRSALIGVVHQGIIDQVTKQQKRNLRIVPYPGEGRYKVESVDSNTLKDVKVRDAEDNQGTSHYHDNQVVVKFRSDPTPLEMKQITKEIDATVHKKIGYTYVFESKRMNAKQLMGYFAKWNVVYTEPHFLYMTNEDVTAANTPNDALYAQYQWNLPNIETEKGWSKGKGSTDVVVAVVDTGVDTKHPDLQGNLVGGANIVDDSKPPNDDVGHGTHVAGVISAIVNNGVGVAGMTWYNKVMPVKVLDSSGAGSTYAVAQGIIWATDHGAKVINLSLGNYAEAQFLHDAIKYAYDKDVVLIAASGNDNTNQPGYPAAYPEVLAVAASDSNNQKAPFSNYGNYIDVTAPGVSIASTYPHNQYAAMSGTSMASPHASALAALIRSVNPGLKNTEVMDIMRKSAIDLGTKGKDDYFGYGLIDVNRALASAVPPADKPFSNPAAKPGGAPISKPSPIQQWLSRLRESLR